MSRSSRDEVITTTGMRFVRGSVLIRRRTSSPSTLGNFRSRNTTLGAFSTPRPAYVPVAKMNSRASAPSRTRWTRLARFCFRSARSASSASSGLSSTSRISTPVRFMRPSSFRGKREVERAPAPHRPFGPHAPAVPLYDALHDGETHAGALELLGAVEPLEDLEQLLREPRVEPGPVVADEVRRLGSPGTADLDRRLGDMLGELQRVADQVDEDLLEHPAVAAGRRQVADADRHRAVWLRPLKLPTDSPGNRRHVDRHAFELLAAEPR